MKTPSAYVQNATGHPPRVTYRTAWRTANENEMRLSAVVCTANIAGVADGEWALIAPYGRHASPDGSYDQEFFREDAERVVRTWNSLTGVAARVFKNLLHGLGPKRSAPVWDGHPETDKLRWPKEKLLCEVEDLRVAADGLEGQITWNTKGQAARTRGPLYPSPLWWHWPPSGMPPTVHPELLESIGLVTTPNIAGVPAWTANANPFAGEVPVENPHENAMSPQELAALRKSLGLPENAEVSLCITTAATATANAAQLTERETALQTANSAKAGLETQVSTLAADNEAMKAANTTLADERNALQTANATLTKGILDVAEKRGVITPAERPAFETRLATANTQGDALNELQTRKPPVNTKHVEIGGVRFDLSTANSRQAALQAEVQKRLPAHNGDFDAAYASVRADQTFAPLFDAMQDPTRKSEA
jgi:hypothetical protein